MRPGLARVNNTPVTVYRQKPMDKNTLTYRNDKTQRCRWESEVSQQLRRFSVLEYRIYLRVTTVVVSAGKLIRDATDGR